MEEPRPLETPRLPVWFGGPFRRALSSALAVMAVALACGWPHWRDNGFAAAVTLLGCGGFALAGSLLTAGRPGRRTGILFLTASLAWAITWSAAWNAGVAPLVSVFAQSAFYLATGTGVLVYPGRDRRVPRGTFEWAGRFPGHDRRVPRGTFEWAGGQLARLSERLWVVAAALTLFGGQALLCLSSEPEWNGFATTVIWPSLFPDTALFDALMRGVTGMLVVLVGCLVTILALRLPRRGPLERPLGVLVAAAVAVAMVTAVAVQGTLAGPGLRLDDVLGVYLVQGTSALALPLVFLGTRLRSRLAELTVAERMLRLTDPAAGPVSVERVRDALRTVLRDGTLDLWFWMPEDDVHVDVTGLPVDDDGVPGSERWRREVRMENGVPLATVEVSAALHEHPSLVEAALLAGGRALETARLQATARAHLERAHAARERLVRVHTAERERLANELHDSAQRRLRSLEAKLERLEAESADPAAREQARTCRRELGDAMDELGGLARGVHPAILAGEGLGPALASVVHRTSVPFAELDVPESRFTPEVESTLYFALCEAFANAVKHAKAGRVRISVRVLPGRIVAEAMDDGIGMAQDPPGHGEGGLAGMIDRVGALRGTVEITGGPQTGTTVRISLPFS